MWKWQVSGQAINAGADRGERRMGRECQDIEAGTHALIDETRLKWFYRHPCVASTHLPYHTIDHALPYLTSHLPPCSL